MCIYGVKGLKNHVWVLDHKTKAGTQTQISSIWLAEWSSISVLWSWGQFTTITRFHCLFQHPYIETPVLSTANESWGLVIRPFYEAGTLRDYICKCKPKGHFLKKYAQPTKVTCVDVQMIQMIGRQILETLNLLHEKGLPYGKCITDSIKDS
jgi:serine/threonine protein kinase